MTSPASDAALDTIATAAAALASVLERENRKLAALDLAAAAALLPEKQRAVTDFTRSQSRARTEGKLAPAAHAQVTALAARLRTLAAENRRLLERGLAAQGRVVAVIARAARAHRTEAPRYARSGAFAGPRVPAPLAISARI